MPVTIPLEGISQPRNTSEPSVQEQSAATNQGMQEKKFPVSEINAFVPVPMKVPARAYKEKPVTVDNPFGRLMSSSNPSVTGSSSNTANNKPLEPWFFMG